MNFENVIVDERGAEVAQPNMRKRIASQAMILFAQKGFSKANIIDLAKACEMSPANLYRYFRNKQAIADAVVKLMLEDAEARVKRALEKPMDSVEARLRHFVTEGVMCTVEGVRRAPKLTEIADSVFERPEGAALVEAAIARRHARVSALLQEGQRAGEFRDFDVSTTARAIELSTRFFLAPFAISRHGIEHVERELSITLDLICAGLRAR